MFYFNKKIKQPRHLELKLSALHGRGVFAINKIYKGSLIEEAPVVFLMEEARQALRNTSLFNYYFLLKQKQHPAPFGFGFAPFYNHSAAANAFYSFSNKRNSIRIYAFTTIEAGVEICINYNGHPLNKEEVYFPGQDR